MDKMTGKVWVLGDDIDTDIIIPTQWVCVPMEEMKHHAFEPLRPDLADQLRAGDILVAGDNFGCGSSREMAAEVDKFAHCMSEDEATELKNSIEKMSMDEMKEKINAKVAEFALKIKNKEKILIFLMSELYQLVQHLKKIDN